MLPKRVGVPMMIGIVVRQLGSGGNRRLLVELEARLPRNVVGHRFRRPLDDGFGSRLAHAFGNGLSHFLDVAVTRIVENENLGHVLYS